MVVFGWGDIMDDFHFSLKTFCIGEGNGNPLQCSCLENPRDGGATVCGVAQSWTRLKRLSSNSSSSMAGILYKRIYYFYIFISNTWTVNSLMFKLVLEKAEEPEIKLPTSAGSWKKLESSRKTSISLYWLCQSLWLCGSQ